MFHRAVTGTSLHLTFKISAGLVTQTAKHAVMPRPDLVSLAIQVATCLLQTVRALLATSTDTSKMAQAARVATQAARLAMALRAQAASLAIQAFLSLVIPVLILAKRAAKHVTEIQQQVAFPAVEGNISSS